jgi:type I restriction enzyme M protein
LLAVISLPQTAFSHYGAGVKASILFLRRFGLKEKAAPDARVFMATPRQIGYDAQGHTTDNDLPHVAEAYREWVNSGRRD